MTTEPSTTIHLGAPLRDAAVDPRPGDASVPTNAGQPGELGNPHGPHVVAPEAVGREDQARARNRQDSAAVPAEFDDLDDLDHVPLVNRVTAFGNDPALWPALIAHLRTFDRPVTVWSAGCHTGCETYTLAMHVLEAGLDNVRVVASDALTAQLALTRRGLYFADEVMKDVKAGRLPDAMHARYFRPAGRGLVEITDDVRGLVEVLPEPLYVPERVDAADVIMLRNIWVHLTPGERLTLVQKLAECLPADGLVVFRNLYPAEVERFMPPRGGRGVYVYGRPYVDVVSRQPSQWGPEQPHRASQAHRPG
jgi:hypothetical protein